MSILEKYGVAAGFEEAEQEIDLSTAKDPVDVAMDLADVSAELVDSQKDLSTLSAAYEAIDYSIQLDKELLAKGLDSKEVAIVGFESFKTNLMFLGVDPDSVTGPSAGFESVAGFEEDKQGMLKKIWGAIANAAKAAWEALVKFVSKIIDFVKGVFGSKKAVGDKLEAMVKAFEEKEIEVDWSKVKFEDKDAEEVAKSLFTVALVNGNKIDKKGIEDFVKTCSSLVSTPKIEFTKIANNITDPKVFAQTIQDYVNNFKKLATIDDTAKKIAGIEDWKKEVLKDEKEADVYLNAVTSEYSFNKVTITVTYANKKVLDAVKIPEAKEDFSKEETVKELVTAVKKVLNAVKIGTYSATIDEKKIKDVAKNVAVLTDSDIKEIAKKLEDTKAVVKVADATNKETKDKQKLVEDLIKGLSKDTDEFKEVVGKFLNKLYTGVEVKVITGKTKSIMNLVGSPALVVYAGKCLKAAKAQAKEASEKK